MRSLLDVAKTLLQLPTRANSQIISELNTSGAGLEESIPAPVFAAVELLKRTKVTDYSCGDNFCKDALLHQRLLESAFPIPSEAGSRNVIDFATSSIQFGCKSIGELNGVRLSTCN